MKLLGKIEQAQDAVSKEYVDGMVEQGSGGVSQEDFDALYNGVVEAEEVTAAALVNLDERVNALSENVAGEAATKIEVAEAVAAINATIVENEEITAAALVDLNTRLAALEAAIANL